EACSGFQGIWHVIVMLARNMGDTVKTHVPRESGEIRHATVLVVRRHSIADLFRRVRGSRLDHLAKLAQDWLYSFRCCRDVGVDIRGLLSPQSSIHSFSLL